MEISGLEIYLLHLLTVLHVVTGVYNILFCIGFSFYALMWCLSRGDDICDRDVARTLIVIKKRMGKSTLTIFAICFGYSVFVPSAETIVAMTALPAISANADVQAVIEKTPEVIRKQMETYLEDLSGAEEAED